MDQNGSLTAWQLCSGQPQADLGQVVANARCHAHTLPVETGKPPSWHEFWKEKHFLSVHASVSYCCLLSLSRMNRGEKKDTNDQPYGCTVDRTASCLETLPHAIHRGGHQVHFSFKRPLVEQCLSRSPLQSPQLKVRATARKRPLRCNAMS